MTTDETYPDPETGGDPEQRSIQSVVIGFRLITALEEAGGPATLKELASAAQMPSSRAHAYLTSFRKVGLVTQEGGGGRYDLGPRALLLGMAALSRLDIRAAASEPMRQFCEETGEAVHLSVWSGSSPVIVARLVGRRGGSLSIRLGYALPLDRSASGRIFVAFSAAGQRRQHGLSAAQIKTVLRDGVAVTDGLLNAGFAAISAPVFDHMGDLAAALTTLGAAGHIDVSLSGSTSSALRRAAQRVSSTLGFEPAP